MSEGSLAHRSRHPLTIRPLITEPSFNAIRAEGPEYRAAGLPVFYARSFCYSESPVGRNALVISRMK